MSNGVEFDEDNFSYRPVRQQTAPGVAPGPALYVRPQYASQASGMTGWLISHGWAKSKGAAQGIMIGIVVVNIIITYIMVRFFL
jgi:hypothetical protein